MTQECAPKIASSQEDYSIEELADSAYENYISSSQSPYLVTSSLVPLSPVRRGEGMGG